MKDKYGDIDLNNVADDSSDSSSSDNEQQMVLCWNFPMLCFAVILSCVYWLLSAIGLVVGQDLVIEVISLYSPEAMLRLRQIMENTLRAKNGVHVFCYNFGESERIWMKYGAL